MAIPASLHSFRTRNNDGISNVPVFQQRGLFIKFETLLRILGPNDVMVWAAPMYDEDIEADVMEILEEEILKYGYENILEALRTWLVYETSIGQEFLDYYYIG